MAVISQEKIYLKTGATFNRVVKYSKSQFSIELPEALCNDLLYVNKEHKIIYGNTESEVKDLFKEELKKWETAVTDTIKVIIFEAEFQGALASKDFHHYWESGYKPAWKQVSGKWDFSANDISHDKPNLGLTLQWGVYDKKQFKDKVDYKFISGRPFSSFYVGRGKLSSDLVEIGHTPEREQFFLQLDQSFAEMIAKIHKALGDLTPEKLQLLADSGLKLLTN